MNIKQLHEKIYNTDKYDNIIKDWVNIFNELLIDLKVDNPKIEQIIMNDLYVSVYGEHFDKDTAIEAVSGMKNVDGTKGEHWTITQTNEAAKKFGITFDTYNQYDFYYVLNMMYNDYYNIFTDDVNSYIQIAVAWLDDPDVSEGKAWRYYRKVVKSC